MDIAQEMLTNVITGDESWVYGYDIETKAQSSQWKAFCYDLGDKRKIEIKAFGYTNKTFQKYFEDWKKCWHKCIISEVGYFEGDKIVIAK